MFTNQKLNALVLKIVVECGLIESRNASDALLNLSEEALTTLFRHSADVGLGSSVLEAQRITVSNVHLFHMLEDRTGRASSEHTLGVVLICDVGFLVISIAKLIGPTLPIQTSDIVQDLLERSARNQGLGDVGPIKTVDTVGAEYAALLLDALLISETLLDKEAELRLYIPDLKK